MQVRYRYRIYPAQGQQQALARAFGWSRDLPSVPSSVTVIREPDGRYYASFVVERQATPLPACGREVGIDLGLASLAVTSDGDVIPTRGSCGARNASWLARSGHYPAGRKAP